MLGAVVIEIVFNLLHIKMILLYHTQEIIELYLTWTFRDPRKHCKYLIVMDISYYFLYILLKFFKINFSFTTPVDFFKFLMNNIFVFKFSDLTSYRFKNFWDVYFRKITYNFIPELILSDLMITTGLIKFHKNAIKELFFGGVSVVQFKKGFTSFFKLIEGKKVLTVIIELTESGKDFDFVVLAILLNSFTYFSKVFVNSLKADFPFYTSREFSYLIFVFTIL